MQAVPQREGLRLWIYVIKLQSLYASAVDTFPAKMGNGPSMPVMITLQHVHSQVFVVCCSLLLGLGLHRFKSSNARSYTQVPSGRVERPYSGLKAQGITSYADEGEVLRAGNDPATYRLRGDCSAD